MTDPAPPPPIAQTLLDSYRGPAIFCAREREPILNAPAKLLDQLDRGWLPSLITLVRDKGEALSIQAPPLTKIIPEASTGTDGSTFLMILWSLLPVKEAGGVEGWLLAGNDLTFEYRMRAALTESRQRFKDLVEISSDFAWETDAKGDFTFLSGQGVLGYQANDLVGKAGADLLEDRETASPFMTKTRLTRAEYWLRGAQGQILQVLVSAIPLHDADDQWCGARGICVDITEARTQAAALAQIRLRDQMIDRVVLSLQARGNEKPFAQAASALTHALRATAARIFRTTENGVEVAASYGEMPALEEGFLLEEKIANSDQGHWLTAMAHYNQQMFGGIGLWRAAGQEPWGEQDADMLRRIAEHVAIVMAQLSYQDRLLHLSEYDGLTALYNRRAFVEKIGDRLSRPGRTDCALLYMDLDNFKAVNDLNGHPKGDEVLRTVGASLRKSLRPGDLAGRLGGDEFAIWLERAPLDEAQLVGERFVAIAADMRHLSASPEKPLGVSVGLAPVPGSWHIDAEGLLAHADEAMLVAKRTGKGRLSILEKDKR